MTGLEWEAYADVEVDREEKITEFDYENYFPKEYLEKVDTQSEEFKDFIRYMNFISQTELETH
jgi:hypothetical protein